MYALDINSISKTYKNGVKALNEISLQVEEGDFYALLGANGAGKSTLIGIITSVVNKTQGQVCVFNFDIDKQLEDAKAQIGLVPQEFNFNPFEPPIQILVNQAGYYGIKRAEAHIRAKKYLKKLALWEKRDSPARALSGGMKRRLMIARALMHEPRLLILDEPTAGVDIEVRRTMWHFLQELNAQGLTIILTTHYLEEAEMLCRNIGIIHKGCLVENTSMKKLLSRLNSAVFILDVESLPEKIISKHFNVLQKSKGTLEIEISKTQSINNVFNELSSLGIRVNSLRNKANRLEELFIDLISKEDSENE
ncbi:MAG: ABC transporter ATP-binding protein [Psychromonas sp.]|nr:ABC transporter ATP-binding protein [Psychromonas sp.]